MYTLCILARLIQINSTSNIKKAIIASGPKIITIDVSLISLSTVIG